MTDHELILKMIETVLLDDTAKLDQIDRKVTMWLMPSRKRRDIERGLTGLYGIPKYTRSRDALKAIRPEGWDINIDLAQNGNAICEMENTIGDRITKFITSNIQHTEELSELHAIIQAIAYESSQNA
jgi:hypothetical protein